MCTHIKASSFHIPYFVAQKPYGASWNNILLLTPITNRLMSFGFDIILPSAHLIRNYIRIFNIYSQTKTNRRSLFVVVPYQYSLSISLSRFGSLGIGKFWILYQSIRRHRTSVERLLEISCLIKENWNLNLFNLWKRFHAHHSPLQTENRERKCIKHNIWNCVCIHFKGIVWDVDVRKREPK